MTDEEKAEEYIENVCGKYDYEWDYSDMEQAFLNGLAEGRKELKEELRQKSDTNHSLVEQLADKEIVISELKEQIKKMRCCRNCKHFNQVEIHCDLYSEYKCVNHDKWEVME